MRACVIALLVFMGMAELLYAAAERPFRLPMGTVVTGEDTQGDTWRENCVIAQNDIIVRKQLIQCLTASHWRLVKTVPLYGKDGTILMQWSKGRQTLLLMVWRIDASNTGFAWGL